MKKSIISILVIFTIILFILGFYLILQNKNNTEKSSKTFNSKNVNRIVEKLRGKELSIKNKKIIIDGKKTKLNYIGEISNKDKTHIKKANVKDKKVVVTCSNSEKIDLCKVGKKSIKELENVIEKDPYNQKIIENKKKEKSRIKHNKCILTIEEKDGKKGTIVEVAVYIKNNPGILGATMSLIYDEKTIVLKDVKNGKALEKLHFTKPSILKMDVKLCGMGQK